MEIHVKNAPVMEYDAIVIPFSNEKTRQPLFLLR